MININNYITQQKMFNNINTILYLVNAYNFILPSNTGLCKEKFFFYLISQIGSGIPQSFGPFMNYPVTELCPAHLFILCALYVVHFNCSTYIRSYAY